MVRDPLYCIPVEPGMLVSITMLGQLLKVRLRNLLGRLHMLAVWASRRGMSTFEPTTDEVWAWPCYRCHILGKNLIQSDGRILEMHKTTLCVGVSIVTRQPSACAL